MLQLLRYVVFPISLLYAATVHIRNFLFDIGVFRSEVFDTPTIAIGNLTVGGTGKTPMVAYLVYLLGPKYKLAVLSRGYKRKSKGFVLANDTSSVFDLGDEPFLLANKLPHVQIALDTNRRRGIRELERRTSPDLIIMDDAYQHRWVKPRLSLLLTSYGALYPKDWYLPTGNLRDAKNQSKRADVIVVTKCPKPLDPNKKNEIVQILKPDAHQKVVFGTLQYADHFSGINENITYDALMGKKVALVTGIADPEPLLTHLKNEGASFEHLRFSDHHNFTNAEIKGFMSYDMILTTEKDFVRFENRLPNAYYLEVKHHFSSEDREIILNFAKKAIQSAPQPFS